MLAADGDRSAVRNRLRGIWGQLERFFPQRGVMPVPQDQYLDRGRDRVRLVRGGQLRRNEAAKGGAAARQ